MYNQHMCYILYSTVSNKIYIGYTVDFFRRFRQHNGVIKGGAKKTSKHRPWLPLCVISGFHDNSSALRFEYRLQKRKLYNDKINSVIDNLQFLVNDGDGKKDCKLAWPKLTFYWNMPLYLQSKVFFTDRHDIHTLITA